MTGKLEVLEEKFLKYEHWTVLPTTLNIIANILSGSWKNIIKKLNRQNLSVLFNQTWLDEYLLPKYTYIYIYIYNNKCMFQVVSHSFALGKLKFGTWVYIFKVKVIDVVVFLLLVFYVLLSTFAFCSVQLLIGSLPLFYLSKWAVSYSAIFWICRKQESLIFC